MKCIICDGPKIDHEVLINGKFVCRPACLYKLIGVQPRSSKAEFVLSYLYVGLIFLILMRSGLLALLTEALKTMGVL